MCSAPSGGCGAVCEELAMAAVLLLLHGFPVPEPSPPSRCDVFASGSLLESLLQSPPRKSLVGSRPVFLQGGISLWMLRKVHL